ncbi:peptidoglycan-binding protein [Streptomyces sp. NPDC001546]|uniref:peptidoglycan-binding protein n=1 Tax=Streptomyces sp. NPDC001546 TaxID=3364585 RepID=UPI003689AFB3
MPMPVFEEYEPPGDCGCPGCVRRRRALVRGRAIALRDRGLPCVRGARRALVLATAAGVVLGGAVSAAALTPAHPSPPDPRPAEPMPGPGHVTGAGTGSGPASGAARKGGAVAGAAREPGAGRRADGPGPSARDTPGSPQGGRAPLHGRPRPSGPGRPGAPSLARRIDRATIINRAKLWLEAQVPYSMSEYWTDGYRQDCSGYVSMAWNLGTNEWTGSLDTFATKITKEELLPGDMLLFHNPADPNNGSHVVLFGGWVDETHTSYVAYEQTRPNTRRAATPYGYWSNADKYVPYRYNGVTSAVVPGDSVPPAPQPSEAFPGASKFGPGADNKYVAQLGRMLIDRGALRFYPKGPSTKWSEADRQATQAFQLAQGWTGADADGIPGEYTWRLLVRQEGNDIVPTSRTTPPPAPTPPTPPAAPAAPAAPRPGSAGVPAYPGPGVFRPGQTHPEIAALGRQLARKGFGTYYTSGPGPAWTEADRRNVEAFQRAQGWRGAMADGHPGPETWRRLFA